MGPTRARHAEHQAHCQAHRQGGDAPGAFSPGRGTHWRSLWPNCASPCAYVTHFPFLTEAREVGALSPGISSGMMRPSFPGRLVRNPSHDRYRVLVTRDRNRSLLGQHDSGGRSVLRPLPRYPLRSQGHSVTGRHPDGAPTPVARRRWRPRNQRPKPQMLCRSAPLSGKRATLREMKDESGRKLRLVPSQRPPYPITATALPDIYPSVITTILRKLSRLSVYVCLGKRPRAGVAASR